MNIAASHGGALRSDAYQFGDLRADDPRPDPHPSEPVDGNGGDRLTSLGRLLYGHTWRDSRDWARALDQLSRLSEDDLDRVIAASSEGGPA